MNRNDPFTVLAEPSRRALLDALCAGPQSVGTLVDQTGLSQPVASKHLRILKDAEFVFVEAVGQKRFYTLNPEFAQVMDRWLQPYRELWAQRLDSLTDFLDQQAGTADE